jgi:proliferating cell nuclear antigen PCNA
MDNNKILDLTPNNPFSFKILIDTLESVLNECNIDIKKDCVSISTQDQNKTVAIYFKSSYDNYKKLYISPKLDVVRLGVDLTSLSNSIKNISNATDTRLNLSINSDMTNLLRIRKKNTMYRLKLIQVLSNIDNKIKYSFDVKILLSTKYFHNTCREISTITNRLEIRCSKNNIKFIGRGDTGDITIKCTNKDQDTGLVIKNDNDDDDFFITGLFDLKSIMSFFKLQSISDDLLLFMKNNYVLGIQYNINDLGHLFLFFSPVDNNSYEYDGDLYDEQKIDDSCAKF